MASIAGEQDIATNSQTVDTNHEERESREGSAEKKAAAATRDRDEKLKLARERQNEERQRKIEELKAQAEAAQRYREQKEEERRRRIEDLRSRENEKRHQVEERKRAIMEAEKERREYILRKNQERDSRLELKRRDRNSISFAFGSSTPRLLEPSDFGMVSPSTFWGQRRSTSISNVAGVSLSRRSSERELNDSGAKKRATSASGGDRRDEDIDASSSSQLIFRSVARRKTDLMPTIPTRREDHHFGSRSSLSNTPRTPGRAYSMNRLDQLAKPIRRNGEHISAILERERRERMEVMDETESLSGSGVYRRRFRKHKSEEGNRLGGSGKTSRSMSHLAGGTSGTNHHLHHYNFHQGKYSIGGGISSSFRPLNNSTKDNCSRSGNVTPGGTSRPGSAMSTSTTLSTTATKRIAPIRKPRPASIAGTGVSLDEMNKLKSKPPLKSSTAHAHSAISAQTTPKRTNNLMSTSLIVTSSSSSLSNTPTTAERKANSAPKREPKPATTPKFLPKTPSSDRLSKLNKTPKDTNTSAMTKSSIVITSTPNAVATTVTPPITKPAKSKNDKKGLFTNNVAATETSNQELTLKATIVDPEPVINAENLNAETIEVVQTVVEPEITNIKNNKNEIDSKQEEKILVEIEKKEEEVSEKKMENIVVKDKSEERETANNLSIYQNDNGNGNGNDAMTASMIARSKITTEEEAKAALAERRRLMREEAERQAEIERQRLEEERLAELKRQEEEAETQRKFEEESLRLAEEQRRAEDERLRQAIEEAKQREEEERQKREDEERQRLEREEAEKKAKEEAEKQKIEAAERLKREEKEREERRKRVEAIMSRTRKGGAVGSTPNSTPAKESSNSNNEQSQQQQQEQDSQSKQQQQQQEQQQTVPLTTLASTSSESSSNSASSNTSATTPQQQSLTENTQAMYEQSVIDKENALLNSFTNMIIDENAKNLLQNHQQQQQNQIEVSNGKLLNDFPNTDEILQNFTTTVVSNGNGHMTNVNNKNDINNILQDVIAPATTTTETTTNQLIDLNLESQDINNVINFNNNNNNSLLTTTVPTTAHSLVNDDSHENKDISLL